MTGIWSGTDGGVDDVPPQAPVWNRTGNRLVPATGQSEGAPPPDV